MKIRETVIYEGRRHVVVGVTPFSVRPFKVLLEDLQTKRSSWVEWRPDPVERAALRVVATENEEVPARGRT